MNLGLNAADFRFLLQKAGNPGVTVVPDAGYISVALKIGPIPVSLHVVLTALPTGGIEINITKATASGFGLFGLIRTKAEGAIRGILTPYGTVSALNGNLAFQTPRFSAVSIDSTADALEADLELP